MSDLPVVVIGAGPQGLAAAAHLRERGEAVIVLEAGERAAAAVREWGHVRLFSDWPELVDPAAGRLLGATGWKAPKGYPLASAWVSSYLQPLADVLGDAVQFGSRVVGVGRKRRDLLVDAGRADQPFLVHVRHADGGESRVEARAVIDASGTWSTPNPAGADGVAALGEHGLAERVAYRIPDFADAARYAGAHSVVVGAGHSAMTAINELVRVAQQHPDTRITWAIRRADALTLFGGGEADELVERGALGIRARAAVDNGTVELLTNFRVDAIDEAGDRLAVTAEDGRSIDGVDHLIVLTGFRPDLTFLSEVRLELDYRLQAPVRIAAEVDPNLHSCGSVRATGAADLRQPEPGFFIVGAKSYGRAPTFLALTGYEQVRSVVAELVGDHAAAERVELVLPETGVCGGAGLFDDPTGSKGAACCAPATQVLQIGRAPVQVG